MHDHGMLQGRGMVEEWRDDLERVMFTESEIDHKVRVGGSLRACLMVR